MKKLLLLPAALVLLFAACKKDDSTTTTPTTPVDTSRTARLTAGPWTLTASTLTYTVFGITETENTLDSMEACERDNRFLFGTNKSFKVDEGATKCNAGDPQTDSLGNWALLNNDSQLRIITTESGYTDTVTFNVLQLNATTLQGRATMTGMEAGFPYSVEINQTYQRQ